MLQTESDNSLTDENESVDVNSIESSDELLDDLDQELAVGIKEDIDELNMNEENNTVESNDVPGKYLAHESSRMRHRLIPR